MSGPSPPNAKDVTDQALQYGIKSGLAQSELDQINQVTPIGSLTYSPVTSPDNWVNKKYADNNQTLIQKRNAQGQVVKDVHGNPVMVKAAGQVIYGPKGNAAQVNMGGKPQFNADGTPKTKAVTKLNPDQQALLDAQTATNTAGA
jgi:hypothetical protein